VLTTDEASKLVLGADVTTSAADTLRLWLANGPLWLGVVFGPTNWSDFVVAELVVPLRTLADELRIDVLS